jgi:hypothetical protein
VLLNFCFDQLRSVVLESAVFRFSRRATSCALSCSPSRCTTPDRCTVLRRMSTLECGGWQRCEAENCVRSTRVSIMPDSERVKIVRMGMIWGTL